MKLYYLKQQNCQVRLLLLIEAPTCMCSCLVSFCHIVLPSITTQINSVTVLTGQSVTLTCNATGTDIVYQWTRNGVIISNNDSSVLRINKIKQSDDGIYQCIVSNKGGNDTSNPGVIVIYGKGMYLNCD